MQTDHVAELREVIEKAISSLSLPDSPAKLYQPMEYILSLGGKRIRPTLALLAAELFGKPCRLALPQALAVEVFHNFTLVHDDIMDRADLRRNTPTIHKKWDDNVAILSGDGMFVLAYQKLAECDAKYLPALLQVFSKAALEVCEGQQLDMDLARQSEVKMPAYLEMIRLKTAVLLTCSMQLGAIVSDASKEDLEHIKVFTENIGLAFQIRDDYLDAFGDQENFGKKIGGDIVEGKRTWLTVKAFELAQSEQKRALFNLYGSEDVERRVKGVLKLYTDLNISQEAENQIIAYSDIAMNALNEIKGEQKTKEILRGLVHYLMGRTT